MFIRISSRVKVLESLVVGVACVIHSLYVSTESARIQLDHSCPQSPLSCVMTHLGIVVRHTCDSHWDCFPGKRCCYRGCARTCVAWDPCQAVVCNVGYTCQPRYSYIRIPEADCIPDEQKLCSPLQCDGPKHCPPGFKTQLDQDGCPTCHCEPKDDCRDSGCRLLCAYGQETGSDGCPVCRCKEPPSNPCSDMECPHNEECRLVTPATCNTASCHPRPQCVPISRNARQFDNTCSSWDPSTVHLPVLSSSCPSGQSQDDVESTCDLDCQFQACPDRTVCVRMGQVESRCCWQSTQALLLPHPKPGECPLNILLEAAAASSVSDRPPHQRCQLDAQCPGQQKCCSFIKRSTDYVSEDDAPGTTLSVSGYCMDPSHKLLNDLTRARSGLHP